MGKSFPAEDCFLNQNKAKYFRPFYGLIFGLCLGFQVQAQQVLLVQSTDPLPRSPSLASSFNDSLSLKGGVRNYVADLLKLGYYEVSLDSLTRRDSTWTAYLHLGKPYVWQKIDLDEVPQDWLRAAGWQASWQGRKPWALEELQAFRKKLGQTAANRGYPFVQVKLDSLLVSPGQMQGKLQLDKGPLIRFDTLLISGEVSISNAYLSRYLGFRSGDLYDQSKLLRIRERLLELPYLQLRGEPGLEFFPGKAKVLLDLEKQKASRFDFIIGLLPNSRLVNRFLVTGSFEGELLNSFGRGERIYARFEQLRPTTPRLDLQGNYPYLANLPLGLDFRFNLYKRDTTFLDVEADLGIQYLLEGGDYVKIYWNNRSSRLLGVNSRALLNNPILPAALDVSQQAFGLEFRQQKLDYRFNPRRGWALRLRGDAGSKRTLVNSKIRDLGLEKLYDTLRLRVFQYRLQGETQAFIPLGQSATLKLALNAAFTLADQPINQNEQIRLGGARLMRGFDEEFIFATHYGIATAEGRLILGQNSYAYAFVDLGRIADRTRTRKEDYTTYGFGAGLTFETRAGLFGISLALGNRAGAAVNLGQPKVHFGYVSLF